MLELSCFVLYISRTRSTPDLSWHGALKVPRNVLPFLGQDCCSQRHLSLVVFAQLPLVHNSSFIRGGCFCQLCVVPSATWGLRGSILQKFYIEVGVWLFFLSFFLSLFAFSSPSRSHSRQIETARSDWRPSPLFDPFPGFWFSPTICLGISPIRQRFLGVDYARRLAIDAAKQNGFRLVLKAKKLESTGMAELASNMCSWNLHCSKKSNQRKHVGQIARS